MAMIKTSNVKDNDDDDDDAQNLQIAEQTTDTDNSCF